MEAREKHQYLSKHSLQAFWDGLPPDRQTLWSLNCMISVGAQYVLDLNRQEAMKQWGGQAAAEGTESEREESDNDEGCEEGIDEDEELANPGAGPEQDQDERTPWLQGKVDKLRKSLSNKTARFATTRQTMGWLRTEQALLNKAKKGRSRASSRRQSKRRKLLRKRVPGIKFTQRSLRKQVEKFCCLVKIKRKQKERKRQELERAQQTLRLQAVGPARLEGQGGSKEVFTAEDLRALRSFWEGVWGTLGTYHPRHPSIKSWKRETRRKL